MNDSWSDYEKYLKPIHLAGGARVLTITRVVEEETHPRPGEMVKNPVLYFKEVPFGLILSPTNRQTLIALYGDKVKDCLGKPIAVQAVLVRVGGKEKHPIRIQRQRPAAPSVDVATGEIVTPVETAPTSEPIIYPEQPEKVIEEPRRVEAPRSELAEFFEFLGDNWPTTEAEYGTWLKQRGWNGKETRDVLGTDAKSWLKMNSGKGWDDVAKTIAATLGK